MEKPQRVLARDAEWSTLTRFLVHPDPRLRLAVVSGRRRVGKSHLLRALAETAHGLYVTAVVEEGVVLARRRFATEIARYAGIDPGLMADAGWEILLTTAIELTAARGGVLMIDELPYWMAHSPELPGLLRLLYDRSQAGEGPEGGRVIVCGSALSVMNDLLSGALRGRAAVDLRLHPFDLPTTALHWGIGDPHAALRVHAVYGGSPGYRDLASVPPPRSLAEVDDWVVATALDRLAGTVTYVADSPHRSAGHRGLPAVRQRSVVGAPSGDQRGRPHRTVPQRDLVETGQGAEAWRRARPTFDSRILGPHFEECARGWLRGQTATALRGAAGQVTSTVVNDGKGRARHEIDVIALDKRGGRAVVGLVGEAKATITKRGVADLDRLDMLAGLLSQHGHDTSAATLAIFSLTGFHRDLIEAARSRGDVLLADLETLFGIREPVVTAGKG